MVWERDEGELLVPVQPLRPLSSCQPYFMGLFPSLTSRRECGSAPSKAATCGAALGGGRQMPRYWKEQEQSPFISDSNLSKK